MSNFADAYRYARDRYADIGVDTEAAIAKLDAVPISLHCWQGDDVAGFEPNDGGLTGGIAATGNYPGAARTPDELREDLEMALSAQGQPARQLPRGRAGCGPGQDRPRALYLLDRLGQGSRPGAGFQPHVLLPPQQRRRVYPGQPG